MIQRIQSLWIFVAVIAEILLSVTGQDVNLVEGLPLILIVVGILILILGLSLFNYKNRLRQIMLNRVSIIINALLIGALAYWLLNISGGISFPEKGIEPLFPAVAIICLILANSNIKKDEKLVKSVDRLR